MPLDGDDYRRLRRATRTHREELVVGLCGEAGLRPAEQARIRPGDLFEADGAHLLSVFDTDRDGEQVPEPARDAVLPDELARDVQKYAASNGISDDEPLFPVSARRLSMLVGEVADRTAGVDASVTSLRRRFAARLLDDGVAPQTVVELGGWERLESLEPVLSEPDQEDLIRAVTGDDTAPTEPTAQRTDGLTTGLLEAGADLSGALDDAGGPETAATAACERLAGIGGVRFALVAERVGDEFTLGAHSGVAERTARTHLDTHHGAMTAAIDDGAVGTADGSHGPMVFAPVATGDTAGVLALGTTTTPDRTASDALAAVAGQLGAVLTAVERKRLLLTDAVVELDLHCPASTSVVAALSAELDCRVELSGVVPVDNGSLLYYLNVERAGAEPVSAQAETADAVEEIRVLAEYGDGCAVEVVVTDTPALTLLGAGGRVRSLVAADGAATLTVELAGDADVRSTVDAVTDAHPGVRLRAKRRTDRPAETAAGFRERLAGRLSERQATVLRAAYHAGYFEWPRDSTAEELADSVGVSSPTLHNHLRNAEGKLLTAFFEDPPRDSR